MTKISCTECRERLGELLAAEVAPVHAGQGAAADVKLLRAHINECEECAQSLRVLRAARETMRDFAPLPAPSDLRARIRAQIEREPMPVLATVESNDGSEPMSTLATLETASEITSLKSPMPHRNRLEASRLATAMPRLAVRHDVRDVRDVWDNFTRFFKRPANVAWTSGLVLATFCLVLAVRPDRNPDEELFASKAPVADSTGRASNAAKPAAPKPKTGAAPKPGQKPATKPTPAVPGLEPFPQLTPPNYTNPLPYPYPAEEPPMIPPAAIKQPSGSTASNKPAQGGSGQPSRPANPSNTNPSNANPRATTPRSSAPRNDAGGATAATAKKDDASRDQNVAPPSPAPTDNQPFFAQESEGGRENARTMMRAAPGGPAAAIAKARSNDAPEARAEAAPPVTRFINTEIIPRRDVSWGQISVVLSSGATFEDGERARVVWRGAATAGQPIDISFSASGARGQYSARIVLQEVQRGQTKTVNSAAIPVNLR